MRALGLTKRQLRGLLAWEALLVAGVAAVLGVVAGSLYGLAGTAAVLAESGEVILDFPVLQVLRWLSWPPQPAYWPRCCRPAAPPVRHRSPQWPPDPRTCRPSRQFGVVGVMPTTITPTTPNSPLS